jgi:hypothetical protein
MTQPKMLKQMARPLIATCALVLSLAANLGAADKVRHGPDSDTKQNEAKQTQAQRYERPTDPPLYVGTETCKTCHEDIFKNFETMPHFVTILENKRGPEWQGCEACHGPGKEHVEGGGDKSKIFTFKGVSAEAASERCPDYHTYGEEDSNFARSAHLQNNVGCIDCHSPHHAKENQFLMKEKQPLRRTT